MIRRLALSGALTVVAGYLWLVWCRVNLDLSDPGAVQITVGFLFFLTPWVGIVTMMETSS